MKDLESLFSITIKLMCTVLKVSRSGYYYWIKHPNGKRAEQKERIDKQIKDAYFENNGLYGSPRLAAKLTAKRSRISRITVALHMKQLNIQSKVRRRFKTATDSDHKDPICDNLLNREFKPVRLSLKWVSDITHINTLEGFLCLTTVVNLFDRKVIGWSTGTNERVVPTLNMAIKARKPARDLIFHSDQGVQYTSFKIHNVSVLTI
ncbi:MAG: IS3 family transposase [Tannerellaceae bacterium]